MESSSVSTSSSPEESSSAIDSESEEKTEDNIRPQNAKRSRKNTLEEKRKMRLKRKKRKKQERADKKRKADIAVAAQTTRYKCMARSYWDRWQWELVKRKEAMTEQLKLRVYMKNRNFGAKTTPIIHVHQIDLTHLTDPLKDGKPQEIYLGRGSFSVVRLQLYRGIKVAVKEFLPCTIFSDVQNEASILARFCHPYLPFVFGLCITARPYRIITQFHGFGYETITLQMELVSQHRIREGEHWLHVCTQIFEAVNYLHDEVNVLHNDIKLNNIIMAEKEQVTSASLSYNIVLIDFGKATEVSSGRRYNLSEPEKVEYLVKYPHIAPEVVHGESRQSVKSDMYAIGLVLLKMSDYHCFSNLPSYVKNKISTLISNCKSLCSSKRPSAASCLKTFKALYT